MVFERITSFQNSRLKLIRRLRDRRHRESEKRFVVDDTRDLERALATGHHVDFVLYCPNLAGTNDQAVIASLPSKTVFEVTEDILERASYRQNPSAVTAVMIRPKTLDADDAEAITSDRVLVLVELEKPGNIGALLRTADATGFSAVLLVDVALDIYNPNIIRSSTGACFLNNIYHLSRDEAVTFLTNRGYLIAAGHLQGTADLFDMDFSRPVAVVLGAEDQGLDKSWIDVCDALVRIPMIGQLSDSLNVSISGAIFMYEALRQRWISA